MVRVSSTLESDIVAVERVEEYTQLPVERPPIMPHRPAPEWPQHGAMSFNNYEVRYREGLDLVLRGVSCQIRPCEKVDPSCHGIHAR